MRSHCGFCEGGEREHPELAAAVQAQGAGHGAQRDIRQGAEDDAVQQDSTEDSNKQVGGGGGKCEAGLVIKEIGRCAARICMLVALCLFIYK